MTNEQLDKVYEPATEQPPYPLEASGWGKNTFYHHCPNHGWQTNFAVCVTMINKAAAGERQNLGTYAKCIECIGNGTCPAVAMRNEEIAAGHALYYQPRREVKTQIAPKSSRPVSSIGALSPTRPVKSTTHQPAPAPKPKTRIDTQPIVMDMAKIVNDLAKAKPALDRAAVAVKEFAAAAASVSAVSDLEKKVTNELPKQAEPVSTQIGRIPGESPLQYARRKAMMEKQL